MRQLSNRDPSGRLSALANKQVILNSLFHQLNLILGDWLLLGIVNETFPPVSKKDTAIASPFGTCYTSSPKRISPKLIINGKFSEILSGIQNSLFLRTETEWFSTPILQRSTPKLKKKKKKVHTHWKLSFSHCSFTTQEYFYSSFHLNIFIVVFIYLFINSLCSINIH